MKRANELLGKNKGEWEKEKMTKDGKRSQGSHGDKKKFCQENFFLQLVYIAWSFVLLP